MARKPVKDKGFMMRLLRDEKGNVLFITAAAIIPLIAIIGSGVDMSRAYLTHTRLQQACDAGVLAGRKVMGSTGVLSTPVEGAIRQYVRFNLPHEIQSEFASNTKIRPSLGENDEINLGLTAHLPTAIMKLFGKDEFVLSVDCSARNDYSNIDIALVLDTTGSMACKPERDQSSCSNWVNYSGVANKTMVINKRTVTYIQEEGTNSSNPDDSGTNNVSRMQVLRNALASFKAQMSTIEAEFAKASEDTRKRVRYAVVPFSQMVNAGLAIGSDKTTLYSRKSGWFNTSFTYCASTNSGCWSKKTVDHDQTWIDGTWDGCVEERRTINTITPSTMYNMVGSQKNLPASAYDLQIDVAPSDSNTRWTMADPKVYPDTPQYACPRAMLELQEMSNDDFNDYFKFSNGFTANGGTYLDIGLLWASRLLSRNGLWKAENQERYNGWPVSRFVIFMTDGEMDTGSVGYSAYRPENTYRYVTSDGSATTNNRNHTARWQMICNALKSMDARIFVISFSAASSLTTDMTNCSSGSGYAFDAQNASQLNDAFKSIGDSIGALRLSK